VRAGDGRGAEQATTGLALVLAVSGLAVTLITDRGRILALEPAAPALVVFVGLVAAFAGAEFVLLHVDLRRQAYSFSLSGIPLLLGALFCDTRSLVLARVGGAALVFAWQRLPLLKTAYNLGAYTLEAALVAWGLHALLGSGAGTTITTAAVSYLVIGVVDLLMSSLVLLVISWHQGRVTPGQATRVAVTAAVLGLFTVLSALAVTELLDDGALGVVLIVGLTVLTGLLYRGYLELRNRHQSLAVMHEFVEQSVGAGSVEELAEVLLTRTRRLLNADAVELTVRRQGTDLLVRIGEDEVFGSAPVDPDRPGNWLLDQVRADGEAVVVARTTREPRLRRWLNSRGVRDALIVPLPAGGLEGVLLVQNRLGEFTTFTDDDLTVLQTLAGHLAVALRGAQLVQQLRHDATHDALTGLANRLLLGERVEEALRADPDRPGRDPAPPAVLLLDLDKFKEVNDALGHHVGDALLQVVGQRIAACVPAGGTVARLGGDEFAVLLPSAGSAPAREATAVAEAVLSALTAPIVLPEAVLSTRASIGIAVGAPAGHATDLLRHADTAMYAAKAVTEGETPVVVYTDELDDGRAERLTLLADLAVALERDEMVLHYQPQMNLRTGAVTSVEALVRWRHPERGLLGPEQFVHLAESSGLIGDLTRQVLRLALRQCRRWSDDGLDLSMAVNLSAHSVHDEGLVDDVIRALAESGLPAARLVMEITESSVMGDPRRTVPVLRRLADVGVTLSLDDFGTGYSSLAYLQHLPVREVKIDKSFVIGLTGPDEAHASSVLVRSILSLGGNLGLRVVAEGVENAEVLELLRGLGCDLAQGYHIARPLPAGEIGRTVRRPARSGDETLSPAAR
jgi:diguanylate cyclase (GGDEF)-like protein